MWLDLGLAWVDAKLAETDTPLPRLPPRRARLGLRVRPQVVLIDDQDEFFTTESRTAGAAVVNLKASYTLPKQHFVHHFAVNAFNLGNRLYRNHVSFIKDLAPEMGQGERLSYVMKFF